MFYVRNIFPVFVLESVRVLAGKVSVKQRHIPVVIIGEGDM
jgi:hypothetical protein